MLISDSLIIRDLFLKYGYEFSIAAKNYANHFAMQNWQMRFLIQNGLKPHYNFLDIGCGWLRLAQILVPYLENNRYFGIDNTEMNIEIGMEYLAKTGIMLDKKQLLCNQDFSFDTFDVSFDFAFCHAVFTHLSHEQIRDCLIKLGKVMKPNGVGFFTFKAGSRDLDLKSIYKISSEVAELKYEASVITEKFFAAEFKKMNLDWSYLGNCGHPTGQHVIKVTFAPPRTLRQRILGKGFRLGRNLFNF